MMIFFSENLSGFGIFPVFPNFIEIFRFQGFYHVLCQIWYDFFFGYFYAFRIFSEFFQISFKSSNLQISSILIRFLPRSNDKNLRFILIYGFYSRSSLTLNVPTLTLLIQHLFLPEIFLISFLSGFFFKIYFTCYEVCYGWRSTFLFWTSNFINILIYILGM